MSGRSVSSTEPRADGTSRIVHILPYDGIGGAETAARSLNAGQQDGMEFYKCFIAARQLPNSSAFVYQGPYRSENNLLNYVAAVRHILKLNSELVIGSLWRSCLTVLAIKLLRPRTKTVVFLHLPQSVHIMDYVCNWLAMRFASEIWTDCEATLIARVPDQVKGKARIISLLTHYIDATPIRSPSPTFIYWGRIDRQKGLERALGIFAAVTRKLPGATYTIIGPDRGYAKTLKDLCRSLAIDGAVNFLGAQSWDEIREHAAGHSIYLQTSEVEGMAMSVVEAMQLGLVPAVTPVGGIAQYCVDGDNCIIIDDDKVAIERMCATVNDPVRYRCLSTAASACWQAKPLYRDDVLNACRAVLARPL